MGVANPAETRVGILMPDRRGAGKDGWDQISSFPLARPTDAQAAEKLTDFMQGEGTAA